MNRHRPARGLFALCSAVFLPAAFPAVLPCLASATANQDPREDRDLVGIAEEQDLLARQLKRLHQTMRVLIPRLEAEGRTHALELLRQALTHLDERNEQGGSKTLEELMDSSRSSLESGQPVHSLEEQEDIVLRLERLLSILLDRDSLESLENSLDLLRKLQAELGDLRAEEAQIETETERLREESANEAQRDLEGALSNLSLRQRELLGATEAHGRRSGGMELELLQRELAELARRARIDSEVLATWSPDEHDSLAAALAALERARAAAARSDRLSDSASELRASAAQARAPTSDETLQQQTDRLAAAAERQDRHARASGDSAALSAAQALRQAAEDLRAAAQDPSLRAAAVETLNRRAQELENAAHAEAEAVREALAAADRTLAESPPTGERGSPTSEDARAAVARAATNLPRPSPNAPTPSALPPSVFPPSVFPSGADSDHDLARRAEEALEAVAKAVEENKTLGPALSASQASGAESAERIGRRLQSLPQASDPRVQQARENLQEAEEHLRAAFAAARTEKPDEAQQSAEQAARALAEAERALSEIMTEPRPPGASSQASPGAAPENEGERAGQGEPSAQGPSKSSSTSPSSAASPKSSSSNSSATPPARVPPGASSTSQGQSPTASGENPNTPSENPAPQEENLALTQRELAESARDVESRAPQASLNPRSEEDVRQSLAEARQAMDKAASEIASGRSASAAGSQRNALQALERASQAARQGVSPSSPEDRARADELASRQAEIERQILDLALRMEERKEKDGALRPSLARAAESAGSAVQSLSSGELDQAQEEEEEVQRALEQALSALDEEEEQYQRLRQEELLFRITDEVESLLQGHREAMVATREIEAAREPETPPSRAQKLRLRRVARDEAALAVRTTELSQAIQEEDSVVFLELFSEIREDLERVARDLDETGGYQTDEGVQSLQQDVEESLAWLLESLKQEQVRRRGEPRKGPRPEPENRLVPDVAELKLLRRMEVECLDRLGRLMLLSPEFESEDPAADPFLLEEIRRLAERHERTSDLFERFRARLGVPDPPTLDLPPLPEEHP